ncbi:hypothetical protein PHYPSEUDO_014171 [Phytophthora pseudosyringae]|uniref:Uncharacterized protein n=1 Tax=Phytophthora pseudosyringae TaxID=221518 RepID=A0A8T1W478_9STRA|nr:hypothetical protein PHYPSEUDO_014171 [Phytophthora pseudosyringae]
MMRGTSDVAMGGESKHEDEKMGDAVPPMPAGFSTPRRRQQQAGGGFEFSVTPEPSRRRLSTSRGRQPGAGLEESPARYSPSKVKAAVRSFADFLHFLEEHQQEHALMPVIIQRFAELGAVIESQKRHIDRWKGKELDLAIEEAQQNLELIREMGETIQKQELQIAETTVEKQKWEEKYHLAAQEVEALKKQGTYQIQQLRSEVATLRQAGVEVEKKLKQRDASLDSLKKNNDTLRTQMEQMERDSSVIMQENTTLKQQGAHQSDEVRTLEQQIDELREHYESVASKATMLEQDVTSWQTRYEKQEHHVGKLEDALNHGRQEMGQREGNLEHLMAENRKLQEHMDRLGQEHEKQLAEQHKYRTEIEAERQRLTQTIQLESVRFQNLKKEAGGVRAQIEAQAMVAMKQREQQLLDEKSRVEEELQHQFSKINQENIELRATVDSLKDINRRKSTEIGRLMATSQEAEQQNQSRTVEAQRMQQQTEEVARAKQQIEALSKRLTAKDAAHDEAMKLQSAEFENQYNDFVSQVEGQFNEMTQENEQLRADLNEAAKKLEVYEVQSSTEGEEIGRWRTEYEKLQLQLNEGARENDSLKRELELRLHELESRNKENAEFSAQIEQFLAPDHERTKEVELLHGQRAHLEEQNRELQRLMEETRAEANATMEEAHRVHDRSVEQKTVHDTTVRSLCEEKEAMNRNLVILEAQVTSARSEIEHWKSSVHQLENDKRGLELRIQEVMRQATEQIETQKQSAAMVTEDGRTQLQKLTAQLVQRDAQMNEGHQQLRNLQETVRSLEEKLRTQQYEYESLQMKNEQVNIQLDSLHNEKRELEHLMRQHSSSILREGQPGLENDLSQRLERFVREMDRRVQDESDKAIHLQAVLDSKLETQLQHSSEERVKLEEENARLQRELENYAAELEKLDSELLQLQREREGQERALNEMQQTQLEEENARLQRELENYAAELEKLHSELLQLQREREGQDRALNEMQQTIAAHEEETWVQNNASDDFRRLDAEHKELKATHEHFKQDALAELKQKESEMTEFQDNAAELQSKLDQEKEMTRHLMDRSHSEKQEHANELSKLSQVEKVQQTRVKELEASMKQLQHKLQVAEQSGAGSKQQARVKELEALVKRLEHELQVSEQSMTGREQSVMHEKLQREREHRALQTRFDELVAEKETTRKQMDAEVEEVEHLHQEIDQLHEEIERLHEEIRDNTAEMDNARGQLHVSEQLTMKLEELQDDLAARESEARRYETELAEKEEMLQHARGADDKLRHLQDKMHEKDDEVASLKQQNAKFREQLKRVAQAKLSSKHSAEADGAARETALRELEEAYEQSVQREQELTSQIAHLEAAKSDMLNQFRREMRTLNIEFDAQGSKGDDNYIDESAFHRGIVEISALLRSYQDRETRQDALIHRKEKQINELKMRLDELEHSFRLQDSELNKREESRERENSVHQEVKAMSREVFKLKLENQELRENLTGVDGECISEEAVEWEERCAKLKQRVRELKDANTKLKESRFSKADMKALVKEVEKLTNQVLEKDMQLQALRNRGTSGLKSSPASAAGNGSRRAKDLLEEKIMVLNDHLTGLMTENMQLQHSVEQYAIEYGPLDGATTNGVIGNSGIRVPARTNSRKPAVRSH